MFTEYDAEELDWSLYAPRHARNGVHSQRRAGGVFTALWLGYVCRDSVWSR